MADEFIVVEMTTDPATLADQAVERLRLAWPDWDPNDGDLEVVLMEALAQMAADAAATASRVPPAIFQIVGQELHGVTFLDGTPAIGTVTFTITDADPHTIPEGAEIDIDGFAFTVDEDTPTEGALAVAAVPVTASVSGSDANDLLGDVVAPLTSLSFVENVELAAPTTGGTDPEDDPAYRDRLSRELELQAKTLVTTHDYELLALSKAGIGRAYASKDDGTRTIVVTVTDADGEVVAAAIQDDLAADFDFYRQTTWTVNVGDATYTDVDLTYSVKLYPGYDDADALARIDAMLAVVLSPSGWARPKNADAQNSSAWVSDNVIRENKLIDLIGDVEGVDYVDDVTIAGADVNGNVTLPGTVALPRPGVFTGSTI